MKKPELAAYLYVYDKEFPACEFLVVASSPEDAKQMAVEAVLGFILPDHFTAEGKAELQALRKAEIEKQNPDPFALPEVFTFPYD